MATNKHFMVSGLAAAAVAIVALLMAHAPRLQPPTAYPTWGWPIPKILG